MEWMNEWMNEWMERSGDHKIKLQWPSVRKGYWSIDQDSKLGPPVRQAAFLLIRPQCLVYN
jgi:hypothetical protein